MVLTALPNANAGAPLVPQQEPLTKFQKDKEATFVAEDGSGKLFVNFKFIVYPATDVVTNVGKMSLPGTGYVVQFEAGQYTAKYKEVADAMRESDSFMNKFRPNPTDPTGYWESEGVMKTVTREVTEKFIVQPDVRVKRGAISVGDSPTGGSTTFKSIADDLPD